MVSSYSSASTALHIVFKYTPTTCLTLLECNAIHLINVLMHYTFYTVFNERVTFNIL